MLWGTINFDVVPNIYCFAIEINYVQNFDQV